MRAAAALVLRRWLSSALGLWGATALVALVVLSALHAGSGGVASTLSAWEQHLDDVFWRQAADPTRERRIVLIDIDERSLAEIGPWPWTRETQARLMERLAAQGAGQQIWDVVFAGPGAGNEALASAIQRHRPVLAQVFGMPAAGEATGPHTREGQVGGALAWSHCPALFPTASAHMANQGGLLGALTTVGHITPRLADDGVLRQQPAIICSEGKAYPALALAALGQSMGTQNWVLQRGGWLESPWFLSLLPADGAAAPQPLLRVPLQANGDLAVAWRRHPEAWVSLSAADVLSGRVPSGMLSGAWTLVGGSAFGLNDRIATPLQSSASGFVAHAQLLVNLLDSQGMSRPRGAALMEAAMVLVALFLLAAAQLGIRRLNTARRPASSPAPAAITTVSAWLAPAALLLVPLLFAAHLGALRSGVQVGWLIPGLSLLASALFVGAWSHARSRHERERLYGHLASYLPAAVAQVLASRSRSGHIEASSRRLVVLIGDIRNFSAYAEARPPAEAAAVLHAFFTAAQRAVTAHGGVLEALQGDSIIATWHAEDSSQAARQALTAARDLMSHMHQVLPDPAPAGLEPLALGIGLEYGPAMAGSIGPAERRTHLVMGRTVTVAGRLVEMTTELAHPILVGEGLAAQLGGEYGGQRLRSLGTFILEGLRVPHHVYAWLHELPRETAREGEIASGMASVSATAAEPGARTEGGTPRLH